VVDLKPGVYQLDRLLQSSSEVDVDHIVHVGPKNKPQRTASLSEIVDTLQSVYSSNIAAQFTHLEVRCISMCHKHIVFTYIILVHERNTMDC
jgi:2-oxoglutarate dehydrogenase complex dehydrogenase (E1) component-like enzyme